MILIYRILFFPVLVVMLPYYLWRMWRRGGYGPGFSQRFGGVFLPEKRAGIKRIWLQAVSVGEMQALAPLLHALKQRGDVEIYLTTTTSTGYQIACGRYGEKSGMTIGVGYFPLDWWAFSARAWRRVKPDLVVLMEGERWPEHLAQARKRGVPVLAVNARLSDRSFSRMRAWRWATDPLIQRGISNVLACSDLDAERFCELGFSPEQITVTGNIKWDVAIPLMTETERLALRRELGLGDSPRELIFLGSSTWAGEEDACVMALKDARAAGVKVRLLLVPRHMERRAEVEAVLQKIAPSTGLSWHLRSRGVASSEVDIAVGDTTGELRKFTQLADLVFVGKSLAPHTEGQTPVEAAALGKAIICGQGISNFREIVRSLQKAGALISVNDASELSAAALRVLSDAEVRTQMSASAASCARGNQGAVARTLEVFARMLTEIRSE